MKSNYHLLAVTLLLLCIIYNCNGQYRPNFKTVCEKDFIVDIKNGTLDSRHNLIYNNVTYPPEKHFIYENKQYGCICDVQLCISKCCGLDHPLNVTCEPGFTEHVKLNVHHDNGTVAERNAQHVSTYMTPCRSYIKLESDDVYYIKSGGILFFDDLQEDFEHHQYCVSQEDHFDGEILVQICFGETRQNPVHETAAAHLYGMVISIPFLFATLLVYLILPEKKIQTKCLMAYVTCLMFAYFVLIYIQFSDIQDLECDIFASCGVYFFMAAFCWMNVTCVDMYWTFSGRRSFQQGPSSKWKRFGLYCLFANGTPFILLGVIYGVNSLEPFEGHPRFALNQCWIEQGLPELIFFYGPMAVLLSINTILFIITAITIRSTIVDNQRMLRGNESHRHSETNKQDYKLYIKLFIAMGINWFMEFISWAVNWRLGANKIDWLWYPTDFCNAIYGVFIFVIFVCKKAVWIKLRQRYYVSMGKPNMARAIGSGTSGYQMSQTERTNMDETTATSNHY